MDWYKVKEKSAGDKRLLISWYLYKIFGTRVLLIISFFVALFTYLLNSDLRGYSRKYFEAVSEYFNDKSLKPSRINVFKHILSYANSLAYKIETFSGGFKSAKVSFADETMEKVFYEKIKNKEGRIFIFSHVGNIDVLRSYLTNSEKTKGESLSILLQKEHCEVFNSFLKKIEKNPGNIKVYPIEEIDITTVSQLDDDLKQGGALFIAGDRIASNNPEKSVKVKLFNKNIFLPLGTFKFPKILGAPVYFISVVKEGKEFKIYLEPQEVNSEEVLRDKFIHFIEKMTKIAPYQFYHFYDIFMDNQD
ncbi:hypothetical protein IKQ26_04745 [bacterium]|nr:hypothetical protein [bacterium]